MSNEAKPALASMVRAGDSQTDATPIGDFIFMVRDISNLYLVRTGDGDVLINTGFMDNAERNKALLAPVRQGPLKTIILTQSHADHFGGLPAFQEPGTKVIGGPRFAENWAEMKGLQPFFGPRTAKLWASTLKRGAAPTPPPEVKLDIVTGDSYSFEQGGRRFECLHTPEGETLDSLSVWLPGERVVFTGNLFGPVFLSMPFLNTLRGDKPRLVRNYLSSLRRVQALGAELLITGHGEPIVGREKIRADLQKLHDAVDYVREATLQGMNAGKSLYQLMREVTLPDALKIGEFHGKVSWAVKSIWHEYSGWFLYESTCELYGAPRASVSADLVELAGGADELAARARAHLDAGRPEQAIHLIDIALETVPENRAALAASRDAHQALLARSGGQNLSETMWLKAQVAAAEAKLAGLG
jgi:glyoxylase-like metal-dependent hydrolase (beta-lactamase superfamily II)